MLPSVQLSPFPPRPWRTLRWLLIKAQSRSHLTLLSPNLFHHNILFIVASNFDHSISFHCHIEFQIKHPMPQLFLCCLVIPFSIFRCSLLSRETRPSILSALTGRRSLSPWIWASIKRSPARLFNSVMYLSPVRSQKPHNGKRRGAHDAAPPPGCGESVCSLWPRKQHLIGTMRKKPCSPPWNTEQATQLEMEARQQASM